MGLAGTRNRKKIGNDPNNTSWSRDTETYGAKIMAAQGWTPGSYLGAKDAAHASHYTAANASHIRVLLKDDNLGVGAGKGKSDGENFGLGSFQDILGRLNGKSGEQIVKEQAVRADLGRRSYIERKWGPSRFVSGGYLVGEKTEHEKENASELLRVKSETTKVEPSSPKRIKQEEGTSEADDGSAESDAGETSRERSTHSGKRKREGETKEERRERRLERRQRKEAKRLEKAKRNVKNEDSPDGAISDVALVAVKVEPASGTQSPALPLNFGGGRQAVRQRYIRQKKMASLDANALREILMIKT